MANVTSSSFTAITLPPRDATLDEGARSTNLKIPVPPIWADEINGLVNPKNIKRGTYFLTMAGKLKQNSLNAKSDESVFFDSYLVSPENKQNINPSSFEATCLFPFFP